MRFAAGTGKIWLLESRLNPGTDNVTRFRKAATYSGHADSGQCQLKADASPMHLLAKQIKTQPRLFTPSSMAELFIEQESAAAH